MTPVGDYYDYLCKETGLGGGYSKLLTLLAKTNYIWVFDLDRNRAMAGLNLRKNYAIDYGIYEEDVADGPCSCLEMLVAISIDLCDQSGTGSPESFFLEMITNMGLLVFDDTRFDYEEAEEIIFIWLHREYKRDGHGNIFITMNPNVDMRRLDTWAEMNVYINEFYPLDENFLRN